MARPPREDAEGLEFHVGNRGIARRTLAEEAPDFRYLLSRLAYAVRRGEIQILAYALMMTHFHLYLRSLGGLSAALRQITTGYARHFNRGRRRDGPLVRGRFFSRRVTGPVDRIQLVRYIDENPVQAGLVSRPEDYPWGSARHYASSKRPPWLSTEIVDALGLGYGSEVVLPDANVRRARAALMEARSHHQGDDADALDDLFSGIPDRVKAWMIRKAKLADGTTPGLPVAGLPGVLDVLGEARADLEEAPVRLVGAGRYTSWQLLTAGLLRDLAAATFRQIARTDGCCESTARLRYSLHGRAVLEDGAYADRARELVVACVRRVAC